MESSSLTLDTLQITFLAIVQGLTEFLPVSSSGHLLLPAMLWGWPDQGLVFDVAVHLGSLVAVVWYFRRQLLALLSAWCSSLIQRRPTSQSKLAWYLLLASIPAGVAGLLLNDWVESYGRSMRVLGSTSIIFALLLLAADRLASRQMTLEQVSWKSALLIGLAQMLALIPGTSRSGVTMTAALALNLNRHAAAQFSFLLAIPIIAASGLIKALDLIAAGASTTDWLTLMYAALVSMVVSFACIHFFLRLIERIGFLPFVIYRLGLGALLLFWGFS